MITTIKRPFKHEAEMAIADLEKRGFTVVFPLTEMKKVGTSSSNYHYMKSRYTSRQSNLTSLWICKLERVNRNGIK